MSERSFLDKLITPSVTHALNVVGPECSFENLNRLNISPADVVRAASNVTSLSAELQRRLLRVCQHPDVLHQLPAVDNRMPNESDNIAQYPWARLDWSQVDATNKERIRRVLAESYDAETAEHVTQLITQECPAFYFGQSIAPARIARDKTNGLARKIGLEVKEQPHGEMRLLPNGLFPGWQHFLADA